MTARLTPVAPAALARAAPALDFLAALDAPVTTEASADFGPTLRLQQAQVSLQAAGGTLRIGAGSVPIVGASLVASGTPETVRLEAARLQLRARDGAAITTFSATGTMQRDLEQGEQGRVEAAVSLDLDRVAFADLPALWPAGIAGGVRTWIIQNITAGEARDGHVDLGLAANADFSAIDADPGERFAGRRRPDGVLAAPGAADRARPGRAADRRSGHVADRYRLRPAAPAEWRRADADRRLDADHRADAARPVRRHPGERDRIAAATPSPCCASRGCNC